MNLLRNVPFVVLQSGGGWQIMWLLEDDLETVVLCLVVLCGGRKLWRDDENRCTIGEHGKCRAHGSWWEDAVQQQGLQQARMLLQPHIVDGYRVSVRFISLPRCRWFRAVRQSYDTSSASIPHRAVRVPTRRK